MGIGASLIALTIQVFEYSKEKKADEEKKQQTVELLSQIQRSVTRFQDVTMDLWVSLPSQNGLFDPFLRGANKRMTKIPKNAESNDFVNRANSSSAAGNSLEVRDLPRFPEL